MIKTSLSVLRQFYIIKKHHVYFVCVSFVEGTDSDDIRCVSQNLTGPVQWFKGIHSSTKMIFLNWILVQWFHVKVAKVLISESCVN